MMNGNHFKNQALEGTRGWYLFRFTQGADEEQEDSNVVSLSKEQTRMIV
jgi:hypothetical protein